MQITRRRVSGFRGQVIGIGPHCLCVAPSRLRERIHLSWLRVALQNGRGFSELTRCAVTNYFVVGQFPTEYLLFIEHIANPFNYSRDLFVLVVKPYKDLLG